MFQVQILVHYFTLKVVNRLSVRIIIVKVAEIVGFEMDE